MAINIDGRWRTEFKDTEGGEIEAIKVQPLRTREELFHVQLVR